MADLLEERFIEASPRRIRRVREQGKFPRSRELTATMVLAAWAVMVIWRGPQVFTDFQDVFRQCLGASPWSTLKSDEIVAESFSLLAHVFLLILPFGIGLMLCATVVGVLQNGWLWLPKKVLPDSTRVNPFRGMVRVFSTARFGESLASSSKLLLITMVCIWSCYRHRFCLFTTAFYHVSEGYGRMGVAILRCCGDVLVALAVFAVLDYGCRWWQHRRLLRMSDNEMREEVKQREGDPLIRRQRQQRHRELVRNRGGDRSDVYGQVADILTEREMR